MHSWKCGRIAPLQHKRLKTTESAKCSLRPDASPCTAPRRGIFIFSLSLPPKGDLPPPPPPHPPRLPPFNDRPSVSLFEIARGSLSAINGAVDELSKGPTRFSYSYARQLPDTAGQPGSSRLTLSGSGDKTERQAGRQTDRHAISHIYIRAGGRAVDTYELICARWPVCIAYALSR